MTAVAAEHERMTAAAARDREALIARLTQQYEEVQLLPYTLPPLSSFLFL